MTRLLAFASVLTAFVTSPAFAQTAAGAARQLNQQDHTFLREAALGGVAEVEMGELAEQRAQNPAIKDFGGRMVQDHGKANDRLMAIAKDLNETPPTTLDAQHRALHDRLEELNGLQFDEAYISGQVRDHEKTAQVFKQQAAAGQVPELKLFASEILPIVQQHLVMAQNLESEMRRQTPQAKGGPGEPVPQSGATGPSGGASGSGTR